MTKEVTFQSDSLSLSGILTIPKAPSVGVLFLHGGGHSNKTRYAFLQSYFGERTIASFAFDFRGCGKSEGEFKNGSLANRYTDAISALQFFKQQTSLDDNHIYLWGSSMGAHVACRVVDDFPNIKGLILQSPAAYGGDAELLELDETFTALIRRENSWIDSLAFASLERFRGRILVVYGEQDNVVPERVQIQYKQICQQKGGSVVTLQDGAHRLLNPQTEVQKLALVELAKSAVLFLNSGLKIGESDERSLKSGTVY